MKHIECAGGILQGLNDLFKTLFGGLDKLIKVDVDKFSGTIKISDLELFELNSYELSPKGKLSGHKPHIWHSLENKTREGKNSPHHKIA